MDKEKRALLAIITTILLWSSGFVFIKHIVGENFSAEGFALARYIVSSIFVIIPYYIVMKKKVISIRNIQDFFILCALGFFGFFIYNTFLNYGEQIISASMTNFIVSQMPVFVTIISIIFFKESINKYILLGFAISIIGTIIILFSSNFKLCFLGIIYVYIATISMSIYSSFQKLLLKYYYPIELVSYCIWIGTIILFVYFPKMLSDFKNITLSQTMIIIYMGIGPGALAYLFWGYAFKHLNATYASSTLYIMPIFTIIWAYIFLSEYPNIIAIIGVSVSIFGSIIIKYYVLKLKQ